MPVTVNGQPWGFQYSPYVYYNEHAIVMNTQHTPMVIDRSAFDKLFSFVEQFPHYFLGSNADLPIVWHTSISRADITPSRWKRQKKSSALRFRVLRM